MCAQGAKANPLTAVLPALYKQKSFELRALCNVIRSTPIHGQAGDGGVTYIDARGVIEQPASIVVLATYCFNNHPIAAASGIGKPYDPQTAACRGPQLFVSDRRHGARVLRDRKFNPFIGAGRSHLHRRAEWRRDDSLEARIRRRGVPIVRTRRFTHQREARAHGTPRWGAEWKKRSRTTTGARSAFTSRVVYELSTALSSISIRPTRRERPARSA